MAKITAVRLLKAGFRLTDCEDGKFWVLERPVSWEADEIAAVCRRFLEDMDIITVTEQLVLQCDEDFKNPCLYVDGYFWELSKSDFSRIAGRLEKMK